MQLHPTLRAANGGEPFDMPNSEPLSPDEVLVRVLAAGLGSAGLSSADLPADEWTSSHVFMTEGPALSVGHEFVGRVETGPRRGQRVVVRPAVTCGHCRACQYGRQDDCEHPSRVSQRCDGAYDPWVRVPLRNCVPVPPTLSDALAALTEPMSIAMQALRVAGPVRSLRVLVMGHGLAGQAVAVLARRAGAAQVVVSGFGAPVHFGVLRRMGFEALLDLAEGELATLAAAHTGGAEFDLVIETSGVPEPLNDALPLLRGDGVVVVAGLHARPLSLDLTRLVRRQHQARGSFRPTEADWPHTLLLISELAQVIEPMVNPQQPLSLEEEVHGEAYGSPPGPLPGLTGWALPRRHLCND